MTQIVAKGTGQPQHFTPVRLQIGIAFFALFLIGASDGTVGILLPSIRTQYHVDNATVGLLFLFSTLGYLTTTFNNGILIDRLGNKRFLLLGSIIFSISIFVLSMAPPFIGILLTLLVLGAATAMLDAGFNSYIVALPNNTALLNYLHAFYGIGALVGPLIASTVLALALGWNRVYTVLGGIAILLLLAFVLVFRSWQKTEQEEAEKVGGNSFITTLRIRFVWLAAFFLLCYVGTEVSLAGWSYSFLTELRHGAPLLMGWIVSGYWAGLTLGRLTLANAAQRIGEKWLIQICLLGVVIGILLSWLIQVSWGAAIGLCIVGFFLGPIFPTTIALMSRRLPVRLMPSAIGFMTSLGSMGAALFSWLAGNLIQRIGLWFLMPYEIMLTLIMLLFWWALQQHKE